MDGFEPRASLRDGHRMTLYSWGNPRYFPALPRSTRRYFDVARATRVVADCHWQERPWEHATGPRTAEGKARSARNADRGGQRLVLREVTKTLNAELRVHRDALGNLAKS